MPAADHLEAPVGERGQASLELLAGVPVLVVAGLACLQLLAVGYALTLADGAVEAGAIALASGTAPAPAAPRGAPGLGPRTTVDRRGSPAAGSTVRVRPPSLPRARSVGRSRSARRLGFRRPRRRPDGVGDPRGRAPGAAGGVPAPQPRPSRSRAPLRMTAPCVLIDIGGAHAARTDDPGASPAARDLERSSASGGRDCRGARPPRLGLDPLRPDAWAPARAGADLAQRRRRRDPVVVSRRPCSGGRRSPSALGVRCALLRAELPEQRALAALAVAELRPPACGSGSQPALRAGWLRGVRSPGSTRAGSRGGARPGLHRASAPRRWRPRGCRRRRERAGAAARPRAVLLLIAATLVLAAFGGALTGKSRAQRAADLAALSAARSMRDDFDRLFVAARRPNGLPNLAHLSKAGTSRGQGGGARVGGSQRSRAERLEVTFPDDESFAPLSVRAELAARIDLGEAEASAPVHAEAEAVPPATTSGAGSNPVVARGGGYSGPLAYRQGEPMRPDVASAFDELEAAARVDGVALIVTSAFRSDAEQAVLWAATPTRAGWRRRALAPPMRDRARPRPRVRIRVAGRARRPLRVHQALLMGALAFRLRRWPRSVLGRGRPGWHRRVGGQRRWGRRRGWAPRLRPGAIPRHDRRGGDPLERLGGAARRAADGRMNFNPFAVSSAGAQGIAQFMPATAEAYGLDDPFDPEQAIDAQARLMSELLEQFGGQIPLALAAYNAGPGAVSGCSCVPPYPETQAYVARILGLMDGAGEVAAPTLEVRLVTERFGYSAVNVPSMPASRWPGTEQKKVYSPASRLPDAVVESPLISSVAISSLPASSSTTTSCGIEAEFSNSTVTSPAGAETEVSS